MKTCSIRYEDKTIEKVYIADSFLLRLRGLIGKSLKQNEGLLLSPCNQIHCFMMSFPIDVIYLTKDWKIAAIDEEMKPGTVGKRVKNCRHVLELPAGTVNKTGFITGTKVNLFYMEG